MDRKPLNALQAALSAREREKEREREQVERDTSLLISPISTSTPAGLGTVEQQRSPSPERPFQGVSRLIDQWQKKSEESGSGSGARHRFCYDVTSHSVRRLRGRRVHVSNRS